LKNTLRIQIPSGKPLGGVLGMFAGLSPFGGIPVSGLLAWEKMLETFNLPQQLYLFCYVRHQDICKKYESIPSVFSSSRLHASVAALRKRWPVQTVLVWHVGLLKLLPFLRVFGARVILFLHGAEIWRYRSWLDKVCLRQVDLFLCNSEFTWDQFVQANPSYAYVPHQVVHLGIGTPLDEQSPLPAPKPVALMIGRLEKVDDYKGHREVIAAWPAVVKQVPDAELWIVGEGDLKTELEQMAANLRLQSMVRFFGRVSEEKKEEMLAACRFLALPSRGEGFGLVYLEAMRVGRPCLVSTLDAGREVINPPEAGLAVDLDDQESLTEAICELLQPGPGWDDWSANARRRYEAEFTAEHFQERLISALQR
jgi:glycosyltransferase involved in cell wall biosynthesis